jgi:hypothetical protein
MVVVLVLVSVIVAVMVSLVEADQKQFEDVLWHAILISCFLEALFL